MDFKLELSKMKNKMKKFNNSYMGFDDIFIRDVDGIDYLLHGENLALREKVENYIESEIDNDEPVSEETLVNYIKQNHDAVVEYINMLEFEGYGLDLQYGVVYRSMLKGTINLYVCNNESDANEVAEILRGLEDAEDEADYAIASDRVDRITVDFIESIRYDGDPEFNNIDIVNYDYIPDIYW